MRVLKKNISRCSDSIRRRLSFSIQTNEEFRSLFVNWKSWDWIGTLDNEQLRRWATGMVTRKAFPRDFDSLLMDSWNWTPSQKRSLPLSTDSSNRRESIGYCLLVQRCRKKISQPEDEEIDQIDLRQHPSNSDLQWPTIDVKKTNSSKKKKSDDENEV